MEISGAVDDCGDISAEPDVRLLELIRCPILFFNPGISSFLSWLAPTTELRQWFDHDASKFSEFRSRYLKELEDKDDVVRQLFEDAIGRTLTLLFAARDRSCNHAVVLLDYLNGK